MSVRGSLRAAALVIIALVALAVDRASGASPVMALDRQACAAVRATLEDALPVAVGFKMLEVEIAEKDVRGRACRLVMTGTGQTFENIRLRTHLDLRDYLVGALERAGWTRGPDGARFASEASDRVTVGRQRDRLVSIVRIVVAAPEGTRCPPGPRALYETCGLGPRERDYWIAVDCFVR